MNSPTRQKLEGKFDQVKGEVKKRTGNEVEGNFDKAKGKVKEEIAEAREKLDDEE